MIYVIFGQTLSGKTTLAKQLEKELGIKQIVTYTDRPKRPNEVNGVDYHFVDTETIQDTDKFFGHRFFYTKYRELPFIYAMKEDDMFPWEDKILVADPQGFKAVKDLLGRQAVSVYLNASKGLIMERSLARGDKPEEVSRRLEVDRDLFVSAELYADVVIDPEKDNAVEIMKSIIKGEVKL